MQFWMVLALSVISTNALARDAEALTVEGGVVCLSPLKLKEGIIAANRGDLKWVSELGCIRLRKNFKVILIDREKPLGVPWQVRITNEGGSAVTAWGYARSFKSRSGTKSWTPEPPSR